MRETLTVAGLLAVALFALLMLTRPRKTMAGDMDAPINVERGRSRSEAEMAAVDTQVLTEADAGEAAALVTHFRELATDEQPLVQLVRRRAAYRGPVRWQRVAARRRELRGFTGDPLAAAIPGRHRVEEPVMFGESVERWFAPQLAAAPAYPQLPAPPEEWSLGGFTDQWTTADVARMVAEAKAAAR